jgi:hypothetical protein
MANVASRVAAAKPPTATETRQAVFGEIRMKWGKFSEQDLSALQDNNDLVMQRAAKYGLENAQAQREVDALMKGRQL